MGSGWKDHIIHNGDSGDLTAAVILDVVRIELHREVGDKVFAQLIADLDENAARKLQDVLTSFLADPNRRTNRRSDSI